MNFIRDVKLAFCYMVMCMSLSALHIDTFSLAWALSFCQKACWSPRRLSEYCQATYVLLTSCSLVSDEHKPVAVR